MNDLLEECISSVKTEKKDYVAFQKFFCKDCRNSECRHAEGRNDLFSRRVAAQPDRLLNPLQLDPSQIKNFMVVDFEDNRRQALRIEIANKRGDWEVPGEIEIRDGVEELAKLNVTTSVDGASQRLAELKGKRLNLPDPQQRANEDFAIETEALMPPIEEIPEEEVRVAPDKETKTKPFEHPTLGNTPFPSQGIIIGDGPLPTPEKKLDAWEPDLAKKVQPGATITLGVEDNE